MGWGSRPSSTAGSTEALSGGWLSRSSLTSPRLRVRRRPVHRCAGSLHEQRTVHLLRGVLIVGSAEQADPICSVETRSSEAVDVIEFQAARLAAFTALPVGKRAAAAVAFEDLALDRV